MFPGIGVDLLHLPRLATLVSRHRTYLDRFARRILTPSELTAFRSLAQSSALSTSSSTSVGSSLIRWLGVRHGLGLCGLYKARPVSDLGA
ncbi:hypothetical protein EX30DRAFT_337460 [Ascodesmis nigricans]|uniref:Uncharacterized protein n=1 Tax=Ascodesmis nigricans TaxID=341454 RepID=A0A4S2N6S7_9PEZI|nr:hypothetical protein EX30DRAFT_337460 [Ascodesmis nigricans]